MEKVLSQENIEDIEEDINTIKELVEAYQQSLDLIISSFEQEGIVQSFYEVGHFGKEQKERMIITIVLVVLGLLVKI